MWHAWSRLSFCSEQSPRKAVLSVTIQTDFTIGYDWLDCISYTKGKVQRHDYEQLGSTKKENLLTGWTVIGCSRGLSACCDFCPSLQSAGVPLLSGGPVKTFSLKRLHNRRRPPLPGPVHCSGSSPLELTRRKVSRPRLCRCRWTNEFHEVWKSIKPLLTPPPSPTFHYYILTSKLTGG
jgi:hypothetical protein